LGRFQTIAQASKLLSVSRNEYQAFLDGPLFEV